MRLVASGFLGSLLSIRTVVAVVLVGAFGVYNLAQMTGTPGLNSWDLIIPTLTDSTFVAGIGLAWWLVCILPLTGAIAQEQTLIRSGSRLRATRSGLAELFGALCAWAFLVLMVCVAVSLPLGFSWEWSPTARTAPLVQASVFSATAFAHLFHSPVLALGSSAAFTGIGYLAVASVALAISARGHRRPALVGLVCFVLWAFVCSLSHTPIPPLVDATVPLSLAWALFVPGGLFFGLAWIVIGFAVAWIAARATSWRGEVRAAASSRAASTLALLVVAVTASIMAARSGTGVSPIRQYFAGAYGDIVSYFLIAVIPLGFATSFVARFTEAAEGPLINEALRWGSYRRWLIAALLRELVPAAFLCLLTGAVLIATLLATGPPPILSGQDGADLAAGMAGLFSVTALLVSVASMTIWLGASLSATWPIIVGVALIVGYCVPASLGVANIAAPYSLPLATTSLTEPLVATAATALLAVATIVTATRLATPARAELFA